MFKARTTTIKYTYILVVYLLHRECAVYKHLSQFPNKWLVYEWLVL